MTVPQNLNEPELNIRTQNALKRLAEYWWIFLIQGIAAVILGILLLTNPAETAVGLVVFLGAYWLVAGVMDFVRLFTDSGRWGLHLILGVLGVLAGIAVLRHPLIGTIVTATSIVFILGIGSIIMGVTGIVRGVQEDGWGSIALGVVNLLIGIWLLFNPLGAALALPIVLGIFALVGGVAAIINSFKLKKKLSLVG